MTNKKQKQNSGHNSKNLQIGRDLYIQQGYSAEHVTQVAIEVMDLPNQNQNPMTQETYLKMKKIQERIYIIRGCKVMLDTDLAELYGVQTRTLNQSVNRNKERFPSDFFFELTKEETEALQEITRQDQEGRGGRRYHPKAFTQNGVAMLSSVLSSKQAVQVNVQIMRAFVQFQYSHSINQRVLKKIDELEKKYQSHDQQIHIIFDAIKELVDPTGTEHIKNLPKGQSDKSD